MSDLLIFAVIFGLLALMNLYRLIKGPNAADRMVASDAADICINTMLIGRYLDRGRWLYHAEDNN